MLAAAEHGSPSLSSAVAPLLSGIVVVGSLSGAGLGLWANANHKQVEAEMKAWVANQPVQSRLHNLLGLIGGGAFLASCYQVVSDFDVFSRLVQDQNWLGNTHPSSWDTLLIVCTIQLVFFGCTSIIRRA